MEISSLGLHPMATRGGHAEDGGAWETRRNKGKNMITSIKRIVTLLFVTSLLAIAATGCNTAHGFGKDMENAGDKIQEGTD